jgi:enediyne biosynthesis protein E4
MHHSSPRTTAWFTCLTTCVLASLLAAGVGGCNKTQEEVIIENDRGEPDEPPYNGPPLFEDVTRASGIDLTYKNGQEAGHRAIIESLGGGITLIDYDGDGLLDVFIVGGGYFGGPDKKELKGHPCKLYKNLGNFKFKDVTKEVGLDKIDFFTHGAAAADYDRDGFPDLVVTGWGKLMLFHNEPDGKLGGGRKFVDVSAKSRVGDNPQWSSSAAWADLDGDGYPELFVCHYADWDLIKNHPTDCNYDGKTPDICPPKRFNALPNKLFRNNRDGTFTDITATCCIDKKGNTVPLKRTGTNKDDIGKSLAILLVDVNGDGKPDIYVANDTMDKQFYLNRTKEPGKIVLEEMAFQAGLATDNRGSAQGSMGLDASDYNRTGLPSLFVTNYEGELHALYRNDCKGNKVLFSWATQSSNVALIGLANVAWGCGFIDIENRGWEDIFVCQGHVILHPTGKAKRLQKPILLRNEEGKFKIITSHGGEYFRTLHEGRGVAFGDLNNDGKIDAVISHMNQPVTVLRNVAETDNHWLGLDLARKDHADIVGTKLTLKVGDATLTRFARGGGSYSSTHDARHIFGLGKADKAGTLEVIWPDGKKQTWEGLAIDRYWRLFEGKEKAEEIKYPK